MVHCGKVHCPDDSNGDRFRMVFLSSCRRHSTGVAAKEQQWRVGSSDQGGLNFEAHASSLQSTNNVSSIGSTIHSSPGFFAERSMMILNRSNHLLMQRVGDGLLQYLQEENPLDRIDYFPTGHSPPTGDRAPDLFVTLDLTALEETGIVDRDLDATVTLTLGSTLTTSNHSVSDSYSPPTLELFAHSTIEHASSLTGVESSSARYRLQGNDIAQEVGKVIVEKLKSLRTQHKALPLLPESFYPEWVSTPEFAFLAVHDATLLTSLRGLCYHNETLWVIQNVSDAVALLDQIHSELTSLDWKGGPGKFENGTLNMRMSSGAKVPEVFHVPRRHGRIGLTDVNDSGSSGISVYIRFRYSMSQHEQQDAYGQMLATATPNVEQLASLRRMGSRKQRRQFISMIQNAPPQSTEAWMMLAEHYSAEQQIVELRKALKGVYVLGWCKKNNSGFDSQIRRLCKKHKLEEKSVRDVGPEQLQKLGLPLVTVESPIWEQVVREGESAMTFLIDGNDWQVLSVALHKTQQHSEDHTLFDTTIVQGNPSSSSTSQSFNHPMNQSIDLKQSRASLLIKRRSIDALHVRVEMTTN
jgi:hypothetical protein